MSVGKIELDTALPQWLIEIWLLFLNTTKTGVFAIPKGSAIRDYDNGFDNKDVPNASLVDDMTENPALFFVVNRTFSECITQLIKVKNWDAATFNERTTLGASWYSEIKKPGKPRDIRIIITICIAMDIGLNLTNRLLLLSGQTFFLENDVHKEYLNLIKHHGGWNIADCNKILKDKGIEEKYFLGDKALPLEE